MTPEQMADGLTEEQRKALCGRYPWSSPIDEEEGEAVLYRLGLWNPRPKYGQKIITDFGQRVRAILENFNE